MQVAGLRYYSPGLGRWTNRDPIGEMNWDAGLHGYLRNAPSGSVDLLGLISLLVAWGPDNDSTGNFPYYEDKLKDDLKKLVQDLDARLAGCCPIDKPKVEFWTDVTEKDLKSLTKPSAAKYD